MHPDASLHLYHDSFCFIFSLQTLREPLHKHLYKDSKAKTLRSLLLFVIETTNSRSIAYNRLIILCLERDSRSVLAFDAQYMVYMGEGTLATPEEMFTITPFPLQRN